MTNRAGNKGHGSNKESEKFIQIHKVGNNITKAYDRESNDMAVIKTHKVINKATQDMAVILIDKRLQKRKQKT